MLYKLNRLAQRCQRWPLVPDQVIICLCPWSQPSPGQGPLSELHSQATEAATHTPLLHTPPPCIGLFRERREASIGGISWCVIPAQGRCGDFPWSLWKTSILAASKSQSNLPFSCFCFSVPVSAVLTVVVLLEELIPGSRGGSLRLGAGRLQRQIVVSPSVNLPAGGRESCSAQDRCLMKPCSLGVSHMEGCVCTLFVGEDSGMWQQETLPLIRTFTPPG